MAVSEFDDPLLQSILDKITKDEGFQQPKFCITSGSNPGDNYCCCIHRVIITDQENEKSLPLIFKVSIPRKSKAKNAMYQEFNLVERNVYQKILPAFNEVLKKFGISKSDIFPGTARYIASHFDDTCQVLVLQDVCAEGFRMIGEVKILDAEHCRQIFKRLAMWHAASVGLKYYEPEKEEEIKKLLLKEGAYRGFLDPVFLDMKECAQEGLKLLPESFKKGDAFKKMEKTVEKFLETVAAANEAPSDLSFIIQGDCWFNNVLYKYNKDNVLEDVCLIDHQATRVASPGAELAYTFGICTTKDTRAASFDDLIESYHNELSTLLRKMNIDPEKIISLDLLHEHIRKYGQVGPLISCAGLSIFMMDCLEEKIHLKNEEDEDFLYSRRNKMPPDPVRRAELEKMLMDLITDFYERGVI